MLVKFLQRRVIRNYEETDRTEVREAYGVLSSAVGIISNIILSAAKIIAGTIAGSIAIISDGFNNGTDALSSIIALISIKLSVKPPDKKHPFGHARLEYLASSGVAIIVVLVGVEILKTSIKRIKAPVAMNFSILTIVVLAVSILFKMALWYSYRRTARLINSQVLKAAAVDSLADVASTLAVLASVIIFAVARLNIDGYLGLAVALFIFYTGISVIVTAASSLLGQRPPSAFVRKLEKTILAYDGVIALHDLIVHDYGPGRSFATVHVEVDAGVPALESHDLIDKIERDVMLTTGTHLLIHMDPRVLDNPLLTREKRAVEKMLVEIEPELTLHDFRIKEGENVTNIIFDVHSTDDCRFTDEELLELITNRIREYNSDYHPVITIDRSYAGLPTTNVK